MHYHTSPRFKDSPGQAIGNFSKWWNVFHARNGRIRFSHYWKSLSTIGVAVLRLRTLRTTTEVN